MYKSPKLTNKNISSNSDGDEKVILFIDDEEAAHISMAIMLHNTKYKLLSADGGIQGLEVLRNNKTNIDLVMLDLMMPDMHGLNVLDNIRKDEDLKATRVIIQTGSNDQNELTRTKELGAVDVIFKPYNKSIILDILNKILTK